MNYDDFNKLTGWIDYDRPQLPSLNKEQRVQYFHKRIKLVLIHPLAEMYKSLIAGKADSSILLCFTTCICCSIEAFGKFLKPNEKGRDKNWKRFEAFVDINMNDDFINNKLGKDRYVELLWKNFRNGLAHGFAISHGGLEHNKEAYFSIIKNNNMSILEIDPTHFYNDYIKAIEEYINELRNAKESDDLYTNFNKSFEEIFIKGE